MNKRSDFISIFLWSLLLFLIPYARAAQNTPLSFENGRIAFAANYAGDFEIYSINPDGSELMQLTNNAVHDDDPNWSPDGSQIVYVSDTPPLRRELQIMNADGSNRRMLSTPFTNNSHPEWSPDGSRIAFSAQQGRESYNLYTIEIDGSNLTQITFGQGEPGTNAYQPTWSPDGEYIAYLYGEIGGSVSSSIEAFSLYVADVNNLNSESLSMALFANIDWSPDGQAIIFRYDSLYETISTIKPDGGNYHLISDDPLISAHPAWSPDGHSILFETKAGDLALIDNYVGNSIKLTNTPEFLETNPHWQPAPQ